VGFSCASFIRNNLREVLLCCNPNFWSIIFGQFFEELHLMRIIFVFVKRKRTKALLGSNLIAILFTDTLQRGRFSGLPFYLAGIPYLLRKPNV